MMSGAARALKKSEAVDEFMITYRNRALAEKAWHCQKTRHGSRAHQREFKDGFIAGFIDVANGGAGCTPSIAPSKYWGWRYQSAQGQAAVNAWFQGFPCGAKAAEQGGIGHWQNVGTSTMHDPNNIHSLVPQEFQRNLSDPFMNDPQIVPPPAGNPEPLNAPADVLPTPNVVPAPDIQTSSPINATEDLVSKFELQGQSSAVEPAVARFSDRGEGQSQKAELLIEDDPSAVPSNLKSEATVQSSYELSDLPFSFE